MLATRAVAKTLGADRLGAPLRPPGGHAVHCSPLKDGPTSLPCFVFGYKPQYLGTIWRSLFERAVLSRTNEFTHALLTVPRLLYWLTTSYR